MSWWTDIRDNIEKFASGGLYDPEKNRQQQRDINAQVKAYQDQTELAKQQLDTAREASTAEKRRIEEKQIRSLRRSSSAQSTGMLGVGQPATEDMTAKLGG
jgi:hypothetical protein